MSAPRDHITGARIAGASLVLAAVSFIAVFVALAGRFDYPAILDRPAAEVLPRLLALGVQGRAIWAIYACIPLLLIPAGAGAASLSANSRHATIARIAEWCAALAGIAMLLGLVRWPSVQWELARHWAAASAEQRGTLAAVFDGTNMMFGRFLGEVIGELLLNMSFLLFSVVAWSDRSLARWVSGLGIVSGTVGLVALWRNVTPMVSSFAEINNTLLPLWLIVWGVALWRVKPAAH